MNTNSPMIDQFKKSCHDIDITGIVMHKELPKTNGVYLRYACSGKMRGFRLVQVFNNKCSTYLNPKCKRVSLNKYKDCYWSNNTTIMFVNKVL